MRNPFASCNTYTFQMFQIKENPPLFVYFLIQFSDWEVKAAEDFHMPNSFPFKNKIIVGHSISAFSFCFPKGKSNYQRTYICLLFVFCFKMRENPLHFPISYYVSIKFTLCLFHVHGLPTVCALKCPHYIVQLLFAAITRSCCMPSQPLPTLPLSSTRHGYSKNWWSSSSVAIVF